MERPEPHPGSTSPGLLHHPDPRLMTILEQSIMLECERKGSFWYFFSWHGEEVMELCLVWTIANFLSFPIYCHCCLTLQTTGPDAEEGVLGAFPPRTLLLCYPSRSDYVGIRGIV